MQDNLKQVEQKESVEKEGGIQKNQGVFNKIWNSKAFAKAAIHFEHIMQWIMVPVAFIIMCKMFSGGSFYWGLIALLWCVCSVWAIVARFKRKKKFYEEHSICPNCGNKSFKMHFCSNCGSAMPKMNVEDSDGEEEKTEQQLAEKKKSFVKGVAIIIVLLLFTAVGGWDMIFGSPIENLKDVSFGESEYSIGELVEHSFRGVEWSKEKIENDVYYIYVEGFMVDIREDVRITFYYEEYDDYFEGTILSVELLDSDEYYEDAWNIGIFLALLEENCVE